MIECHLPNIEVNKTKDEMAKGKYILATDESCQLK